VDLAPTIGIPHQNMMIGDRDGHIAWTIGGRIPDTTDATLRLTGRAPWTTAANHPRLMDPPIGRVWTANARAIDDAGAEALIGGDEAAFGSEYDLGARAKQIHDDLVAIPHATPLDMLKVQTDDNAIFLTRWRDLMIQLLDDATVRDHPRRAELKKLISEWNARATPDAVGYRFVRTFRDQTERSVWPRCRRAGCAASRAVRRRVVGDGHATSRAPAECRPRQLEELPAGAG
jgi:penicillin amidase